MHDSVQRLGHNQGKCFYLMLNLNTIILTENQIANDPIDDNDRYNLVWPLFSYIIFKAFEFSCKVKALLFSPIGTPSTFLNKIGQHYSPFLIIYLSFFILLNQSYTHTNT